jgi:hypothetical protein
VVCVDYSKKRNEKMKKKNQFRVSTRSLSCYPPAGPAAVADPAAAGAVAVAAVAAAVAAGASAAITISMC